MGRWLIACMLAAAMSAGCTAGQPTAKGDTTIDDGKRLSDAADGQQGVLQVESASVVLGLSGYHADDGSAYHAFPAFGVDGVSGNCLSIDVPGTRVMAVNVTLSWD